MAAIHQVLASYGGASAANRISMVFDAGNGSTTFTDTGTGASTWTGSGGTTCSTATILAGVSSLSVSATTDYLETAYNSSNRIPATADWDLEFMARISTATSTYLVSVQDTSATAAGTAFALATNASAQLQVILSDGSTRSIIVAAAAPTAISSGTTYTLKVTRRGSTITLYINGVSVGTGTFSGSVNLPASQAWRIGKPLFGATNGANGFYDNFRLA